MGSNAKVSAGSGVDLCGTPYNNPGGVTTKGHVDNTYERLVSAHDTLDTIVSHIYGDDRADLAQPVAPGIHGTVAETSRLAAELAARLEQLWNRL